MYVLTEEGRKKAEAYIQLLAAKRKEILDAGLDTAEETYLHDVESIQADVNFIGVDEDGYYFNGWTVTDHCSSDFPLGLKLGIDIVNADHAGEGSGHQTGG